MTPANVVQRGRGKGRNPWKIREFLGGHVSECGRALNMSDVARLAKTYPQTARETITGMRNHKRVLEVLENMGCPREYLYGEPATIRRAA